MQIHVLDPDYASSERARANFRLALKIALRRLDVPPRKRYSWEDEEGDPRDEGGGTSDE